MALIFPAHAKERLRERCITEDQVRSALDEPDLSYPHKLATDGGGAP